MPSLKNILFVLCIAFTLCFCSKSLKPDKKAVFVVAEGERVKYSLSFSSKEKKDVIKLNAEQTKELINFLTKNGLGPKIEQAVRLSGIIEKKNAPKAIGFSEKLIEAFSKGEKLEIRFYGDDELQGSFYFESFSNDFVLQLEGKIYRISKYKIGVED